MRYIWGEARVTKWLVVNKIKYQKMYQVKKFVEGSFLKNLINLIMSH